MKHKKYSLNIVNSCDQDWTAMAGNDAGKFCSHCSKKVVDFTNLTDIQIIEIIKQTSNSICGRLNNNQLNRQLLYTKQQERNLLFHKIVAGLLLIVSTEKSFATSDISHTEIVSTINIKKRIVHKTNNNFVKATTDSLKNIVQGRVVDGQTKDALPFASIRIKNVKLAVNTDSQGKFKLTIPDTILLEKIVLQISYIGYETAEITVHKTDLPLIKELKLIPAKAIMGEVVIIRN